MIKIIVVIVRSWPIILTMHNKFERLNESFEKKRR